MSLPAIAYWPSLYKTSQDTVASHLMVFIWVIFWTFQEMYVGKSILFIKRNVYNWDSLKKQFSNAKWTQVVLRKLHCVYFFSFWYSSFQKKKLDMIPLLHWRYVLVGDTDTNRLCHHVKVPFGVENKWQKTWTPRQNLKELTRWKVGAEVGKRIFQVEGTTCAKSLLYSKFSLHVVNRFYNFKQNDV